MSEYCHEFLNFKKYKHIRKKISGIITSTSYSMTYYHLTSLLVIKTKSEINFKKYISMTKRSNLINLHIF